MDGPTWQRINLRDLGGHTTADGKLVRDGLVYRSGEIVGRDGVTEVLAGLGLGTVFDLRSVAEREVAPDGLPPGVASVALDVLADATDLAPARLKSRELDPQQLADALGEGKGTALLEGIYRRFVKLPSAQRCYGSLFEALADDGTGVALFHCTAGKDRTGWAAAVLLLLLGVPEADVLKDFLASSANTLRAFQSQLDAFTQAGGDPELLRPLFGVEDTYLNAAFDEMQTTYGDVEGYLVDGLGLDQEVQQRLRQRLLV